MSSLAQSSRQTPPTSISPGTTPARSTPAPPNPTIPSFERAEFVPPSYPGHIDPSPIFTVGEAKSIAMRDLHRLRHSPDSRRQCGYPLEELGIVDRGAEAILPRLPCAISQ